MRVLIGCEMFGNVREAFREKGHDAWSCDLLPAWDNSPYHYQDDLREVITADWDMIIAFPPCTYLCRPSNAQFYTDEARNAFLEKRYEAIEFVRMIYNSNNLVAIENPVGVLSTQWRRPTQIIEPYEFGHPYTKATCLWLRNLPPLIPTTNIPRIKCTPYMKVINNQYSRSETFRGIANAMADQWG